MAQRRLTRKEQQAHTRSRLMDAAAKTFARRGMHATSIDEVAREAGFTKGAFYANFESKQALFLAMLDERFDERLAEVDRAVGGDDPPEAQARQAGLSFAHYLSADPEWQRLFFEFAAHAGRDADFRGELVARYRSLRERVADVLRRRAAELEVEPPVPVEELALMTFAMANGVALEQLLEPEAVSEETYATMLMIFFTGLRALAEEQG